MRTHICVIEAIKEKSLLLVMSLTSLVCFVIDITMIGAIQSFTSSLFGQ